MAARKQKRDLFEFAHDGKSFFLPKYESDKDDTAQNLPSRLEVARRTAELQKELGYKSGAMMASYELTMNAWGRRCLVIEAHLADETEDWAFDAARAVDAILAAEDFKALGELWNAWVGADEEGADEPGESSSSTAS